jgi:hypothetical protein
LTVLCASLVMWSVMPTLGHAPAVFETIQDHLEMVEEHGHSHGFAEDLFWAMHGHSHDVLDHDHSQAVLIPGPTEQTLLETTDLWQMGPPPTGPTFAYLIERPPRAGSARHIAV